MMGPWPMGGPDATGWIVVAGHLRALAAPAALGVLAVAIGSRMLAPWPLEDESPAERLFHRALVGAGAIGTGLLLIGALDGLRPPIMLACVVGAAVLLHRELRAAPRIVGAGLAAPIRALPAGPVRTGGMVLGVGLLGLLIARALLPPADWDALMYHLPVPLHFLEVGGVGIPDDNLHVAWTGVVHMLSVPLLAVAAPAAVQLLGLGFGVLLALSVFAGAERLRTSDRADGGLAGWGAMVAIAGSTMIPLVAVTARVDVTLALWMWVGHLALLRLALGGWSTGWAVRATMILGFAIGVKYHALGYGVALAPVAVWAASRGVEVGTAVRRMGWMAGGAFVLGAPWMIRNLALFAAPLYPFGAERRVAPWLAELLGGPGHPESVGSEVYELLREVREPFDLWSFLIAPGQISVEAEAVFFALSPILLLVPFALLLRRAREPEADGTGREPQGRTPGVVMRFLATAGPALAFSAFVLAVSLETNPRYLIPTLPALAVLAGVGLHRLLVGVRPIRRLAFAGVFAAAGLAPLFTTALPALQPGTTLAHLVGAISPRTTLEHRGLGGLLRLSDHLGDHTGPEARIVLIAEARTLYLPDGALRDSFLTNWPLLSVTGAAERCLAGTGISHLVVARNALGFYAGRGMPLAPLRLDALDRFLERCAGPPVEVGGYEVRRIRR